MVQASWRRVLVGVFGAVLLAVGGCSSARSSTKVDEKWLARVPDEQLEDVRKAQLTQQKATDEVTRTEVALQDAKHARDNARRKEEAARSYRKAAESSLEEARAKGQAEELTRAREELRRADLESSVAQAELAFRERAVTTLDALERMRARELAVADAELAQQQYLALERSGRAQAHQLSGEDFARALAEARRQAAETQREVDALLRKELQARAQWQQLRDQAQAYGGGGPQEPAPVP